jgi:Pyruvate/2-oxoacid:ferredoxin oxidoreductase delta subunit
MNEAAFQIILEFSVHLYYMYSLTNSYGKWFGFAPRRMKIQQFRCTFCVQYSAISETERFINL